MFYLQINNKCCAKGILPPEVLNDIFSNIQAIHQLHRDFLLPKLEARMKEWYYFKLLSSFPINIKFASDLANAIHILQWLILDLFLWILIKLTYMQYIYIKSVAFY